VQGVFRPAIVDPARPIVTESEIISNATLAEMAWTGTPLPSKYVYFMPPLLLRDIAMLRGEAGRTILVPLNAHPGPLVILESSINHSIRQVVRDLMIFCASPEQTALVVNGARIVLERLTITGCAEGIRFSGTAVDVAVRDSLISGNRTGVSVLGYGPTGASGVNSVTTIRFSGVRFVASEIAVRIGHAMSAVFDDSTIIEGNQIGILIAPTFPGAAITVLLRDVWLEANGQHTVDPFHVIRREGFTGSH